MPSPQPDRQNFLLYLRSEFPYQMDFLTLSGQAVPYGDILKGLALLRQTQPDLYKALWLHMFTRLPRDYMVDLTWFDTSTVKRRINLASQLVADNAGFVLVQPDSTGPAPSREVVFARNHFLAYLAFDYKKGLSYVDLLGNKLSRTRITNSIERLRDNDPKFSRMIMYHINSDLPRTQVAKAAAADPSTVKRRMNYAADLVMQRARHSPGLDPVGGVPSVFRNVVA